MIDKISHYIAVFLLKKDECHDENNLLIYQVGVDVILSTLITACGIFIIGFILDDIVGSFLYLLCFMTIRSYSGGYHATTRTRCFVLTCGSYMLVSAIGIFAAEKYHWVLVIILSAMDVMIFWLYVPIENKNKKLPSDWKIQNRKKAWIGLIGWKALAIGLIFVSCRLSFQIFLTEAVISILILWTKPWRGKDESKN